MTTAWHEQTRNVLDTAWTTYMDNLENALEQVERQIDDATETQSECSNEWCLATEHVLDDMGNALFSIHEPSFSDEKDSQRIKKLKRKLHCIYSDFDRLRN